MEKKEEVVVGVPYYAYSAGNPHQAGVIPPNAFVGDPKGVPIQQTIYRDTPAPFNCVHCSNTGLTTVSLKPGCQRSIECGLFKSFEALRVGLYSWALTLAQFAAVIMTGSKPSLAALVGCMMPFMLGVCFLCPSMDCLWHKYHYCPQCQQKVADFEKTDPCAVMDPPNWTEQSFALSA